MNYKDFDHLERKLEAPRPIDPIQFFRIIRSRWYWIATGVVVSLLMCLVYVKTARPEYTTSVQIRYDSRQLELEGLGQHTSSLLFGGSDEGYLVEKYNIKSPAIIESAIAKLERPFSYYRKKDFREIDVYPAAPFKVEILGYDPVQYEQGHFDWAGDGELYYTTAGGREHFSVKPGTRVSVRGLEFEIGTFDQEVGYPVVFYFNDNIRWASDITEDIELGEVQDIVPVMKLRFRSHNALFCKDFLDTLVRAYLEYDLNQKMRASDQTIRFVRNQLRIYSDSLRTAAHKLEAFKKNNDLTEINSVSSELTVRMRELEQSINELTIQKKYIELAGASVEQWTEPFAYLASGLDGSTDAVLIRLVESYNLLLTERSRYLTKYSLAHPLVRDIEETLVKYRKQIRENLALQLNKNEGATRILAIQVEELKRKVARMPGIERNYLYLQSNFEVNRGIRSFLANKEIEASVARAAVLPSFTVISRPEFEKLSPKVGRSIGIAVFAGILTGLGSIALCRIRNGKFVDINSIDRVDGISLLGIVPNFERNRKNSTSDLAQFLSDTGPFSTAFSNIRTRIKMATAFRDYSARGRVIAITSGLPGEGKSLTAINLAIAMQRAGGRVILVRTDLGRRRPDGFAGEPAGLVDYLLQELNDPERFIQNHATGGFDYVSSGAVIADTTGLLEGPRMAALMEALKSSYQYIILDTAAVGIVAESLTLLKSADLVIFVIRWLDSLADADRFAARLADELEMDEMKILVNDYRDDDLFLSLGSGRGSSARYIYFRENIRRSSREISSSKLWWSHLFDKTGFNRK